ncbi:MAG: hypothetical protein ABI546_17655 [Polaromonas sp.]
MSFLNYWREKNDVHDIGVLVTLRDARGAKRARWHTMLTEMTYLFDLRDLIAPDEDFTGSIEVEAFSSQDLKFQFPGITVFYETPRGISYVHTNQRVYNTAEDRDRGVELNPWQTGFDVDTARHDPFVFLVNGPVPFPGGLVDIVAVNSCNEEIRLQVVLDTLPAYGVCDWRLASIKGLAQFLGDEPGLCKFNLPFEGIHLRMGVGNALKDQSWLSVTHSYFDATEHQDYFDTSTLGGDIHPAFIPFNLEEGIDVEMVLYPIYARCELGLSLQAFDAAGCERFRMDLGSYRSPESGPRRIEIRKLVTAAGHEALAGLYVLQIEAPDHKVPARITYGLNFHVSGKLGTNISASAYLAKSWGMGRRSWRWGAVPVLKGGHNLIMVSAFSKLKNEVSDREFKLTIHDNQGPVASRGFMLHGNAGMTVCAEDMLAHAGYVAAEGDILWYVMESPHASLEVMGISVSADGFVGGDHSF